MNENGAQKPSRDWFWYKLSLLWHAVGLLLWLIMFGLMALSYARDEAASTYALLQLYPAIAIVVHALVFYLIRAGRSNLVKPLLLVPLVAEFAMAASFVARLFSA